MKIARLFIPGQFEDAYVYMGRLILATSDLSLRYYNLEQLVKWLERDENNIPAARYMFTRNDWLASEQFRLLMAKSEIATEFENSIDAMKNPINVADSDVDYDEFDIPVKMDALLDMVIYRRRLYLAANSGFFDMEIDWESQDLTYHDERKRLDAYCYGVSASYGSANASCGDDGLFSYYDDFMTYDWGTATRNGVPDQTADRSLRSSWLGEYLVNYTGPGEAGLLGSKTDELDKPQAGERKVVTKLSSRLDGVDFLFEGLKQKFEVDASGVQFMWNSARTMYVQVKSGEIYCAGMRENDDKLSVRSPYRFEANVGKILDACMVRTGVQSCLVVEAYDQVALLSDLQWHTLAKGQALSVRTFQGSKRYKSLVAITLEDGVMLASVADENDWGTGIVFW